MIISKTYYENIYDLPAQVIKDLAVLSQTIAVTLRKMPGIEGVTVWQNNEPCGTQDVWHYHAHVKGRMVGDNIYKSSAICTPEYMKLEWAKMLSQLLKSAVFS